MAKAPTVKAYLEAVERAAKINAKATAWVDGRKNEFAEHVFLGQGIMRFDGYGGLGLRVPVK